MTNEAGSKAPMPPSSGPLSMREHMPIRRASEEASPIAASLRVLTHTSDGMLIADMRMRGHPIVQVNPAFEQITGYPAAEVIGKNCRYLQGTDRLQPEIAEVRAALSEGRACSVTLRNYRRNGEMFRNSLRLEPIRNESGYVTHFVGLIRDVTHAEGIDRLTGLLDRYGLLDKLTKISLRTPSVLLLVKLDILRFHDINNGFGHDVGDALLRAAAARLVPLRVAAISRTDSNTFALAFELVDASHAAKMVDDVLERLRPQFVLPGASVAVQFAAGFAIGSAATDPLQLVRRAGAALQRSKAMPGHPPHPYATQDERDTRNRIRLANDLQSAVSKDELLFHYQPQVNLDTGDFVGAEALLRWNHGAFGLQLPHRFIGLAEETGTIIEIGAWGLHALAAYAARVNRRLCRPLRFALNVSVIEFTRRNMVALVERALDATGCRAEWLTLELTESLLVPEPNDICRSFEHLRRLGIGISIDDFGTGYSNLRYLDCFPLSEIKIDRSFVHGVEHSAVKRVIVESIVKLGRALDVRIVAEGIETKVQRAIMQEIGCSVGQGYLFAKPVDEQGLERMLDIGLNWSDEQQARQS